MKGDEFRTQTQIDPPIGGLKRTPVSLRISVLKIYEQLVALPPDPQGIFNPLGFVCCTMYYTLIQHRGEKCQLLHKQHPFQFA